jgi:hypothetical protein
MALTATACPSCAAQISPKAYDCPGCGHPIRKPKRGPIGFVFKWLFIAFNLIMLAWMLTGLIGAGEVIETAQSDAERAGAAIGTTLGVGFVMVFWVMGDIILGLAVLFTRPKR